MNFYRVEKESGSSECKRYAVYMSVDGRTHYVCDMAEGSTPKDAATNALGLTLRARLDRSKGQYAMLEGEVFNPERLLRSACKVTDHKQQELKGGDYKDGYTLLTITADGITNKYMVFDSKLYNSLIRTIRRMK